MTIEKSLVASPPLKWALFVIGVLIILLLTSWAKPFHPLELRERIYEPKALMASTPSFNSKSDVQEDSAPVRYVYIDAGGNTGQTVEGFFEPRYIFTQAFKNKYTQPDGTVPPILDPSNYEIFVFEPNKVFLPDYQKLRDKGYNFTLLEAAAADEDGFINFSGSGEGGAISGSGITKERQSESDVPAMDFSAWLKRSFRERDYLICKIDIEGAETRVLTKMIQDGMICFCDRLSVEWHMYLRVGEQKFFQSFNNPGLLRKNPNPLGHAEAICNIPHLRRTLDIAECMLPRVVMFIRDSCPNADPLEKWF